MTVMREFEGGAKRDTSEGKLDFVKALSPIVLKEYVAYLGKHRLCADGTLRDWDNWKGGIPKDVYLSSLGRHYWDTWLISHGYDAEDNHGKVTIFDALGGIMFNTQGLWFELIKNRDIGKVERVK